MKVYKRNQQNQEIDKCDLREVLDFIDGNTLIECDTETTGFDPYLNDILCIQFGNTSNQYLIEWDDTLISQIKPRFEDPSKTFIFQNAKFDLQFLYKKSIVPANIYDTLLVETIITNGMQFGNRGLDHLVKKYAGEYMSKEIRSLITKLGLTTAVIDYALDDVKYLSIIREKQLKTVKEYNLEKAVQLDNEFVKALAYTEYCGIGFDSEKWLEKSEKDLSDWQEAEKKLEQEVIKEPRLKKYVQYGTLFDPPGTLVCTVNWRSPSQVQDLFKKIGVDITIEEDGVIKDSVGVQVLQKYLHIPIVQAYAEYIKLNKKVSSFGKDYLKYVHPTTGRIHTTYQQILNTGRMSSGSKKQVKPNLQQVPSDPTHRDCFISSPGHKLICADYTGQEAVIFANYCMDSNLLAFYDGNLGDMHSYVAKLCFPEELGDMDLKDIKKKRPDLRQKAKAAGFAIQFGGVGRTIADNLGIPEEEGNAVYKAYTEAFPEMFSYFKRVSDNAKKTGVVEFNTLTRRKFFFDFTKEYHKLEKEVSEPGFWTKYRQEKDQESHYFISTLKPKIKSYFKYRGIMERTSYNYPVQGSAADCTKYAAFLFWKWIISTNNFGVVRFVNIVHDEIIVECPDEIVEHTSQVLKDCMEKAGSYFCKRVPLTAEPQIGNKWLH